MLGFLYPKKQTIVVFLLFVFLTYLGVTGGNRFSGISELLNARQAWAAVTAPVFLLFYIFNIPYNLPLFYIFNIAYLYLFSIILTYSYRELARKFSKVLPIAILLSSPLLCLISSLFLHSTRNILGSILEATIVNLYVFLMLFLMLKVRELVKKRSAS